MGMFDGIAQMFGGGAAPGVGTSFNIPDNMAGNPTAGMMPSGGGFKGLTDNLAGMLRGNGQPGGSAGIATLLGQLGQVSAAPGSWQQELGQFATQNAQGQQAQKKLAAQNAQDQAQKMQMMQAFGGQVLPPAAYSTLMGGSAPLGQSGTAQLPQVGTLLPPPNPQQQNPWGF